MLSQPATTRRDEPPMHCVLPSQGSSVHYTNVTLSTLYVLAYYYLFNFDPKLRPWKWKLSSKTFSLAYQTEKKKV